MASAMLCSRGIGRFGSFIKSAKYISRNAHSNIIQSKGLKNSITSNHRRLSSLVPTNSSGSSTLPSNLILADIKVLEEPPKPVIPVDDYIFPTLDWSLPEAIKVRVFNNPGHFVREDAPINRKIFAVAIRKDIVHEVIRYQRAKKRQPKKLKRMGEISGSKKKPHPQKGTGRARAGNKRNSVWRGGQKAHGPVLRDYSIGCNRKFRAMGMMIVLAAKFREGNLLVFDDIKCETHKTAALHKLLVEHGIYDEIRAIIIDNDLQDNFVIASGNLPNVTILPHQKANVYDLIRCDRLAISRKSFAMLQERVWAQYTYNGKKSLFEGLRKIENAELE